jgi:hypothetical protein
MYTLDLKMQYNVLEKLLFPVNQKSLLKQRKKMLFKILNFHTK